MDTFPVGVGVGVGGNCDYKATSVAIAIASLTELGNIRCRKHPWVDHFRERK
jgi:ABC-type tungstate transport system substrate-binding protein